MALGRKDIDTVSGYLNKLTQSNLRTLGMALGLYYNTISGYGNVPVAQYREALLHDWIGGADNVKASGGATWKSLVEALRDEMVSQNGIAEKIEAEQIVGISQAGQATGRGSGEQKASSSSVLNEEPTMLQLTSFKGIGKTIDIAQRIGFKYDKVGRILLDDEDDAIVPGIAQLPQHQGDPTKINTDILARWVQGGGVNDRTWKKVITALKDSGLKKLAEAVENGLCQE